MIKNITIELEYLVFGEWSEPREYGQRPEWLEEDMRRYENTLEWKDQIEQYILRNEEDIWVSMGEDTDTMNVYYNDEVHTSEYIINKYKAAIAKHEIENISCPDWDEIDDEALFEQIITKSKNNELHSMQDIYLLKMNMLISKDKNIGVSINDDEVDYDEFIEQMNHGYDAEEAFDDIVYNSEYDEEEE